jgi:hypothetical protein
MCRGVVDADECLNASLESDLVVCYGTGDFQLATSISCLANLQKPPTFAPTFAPFEISGWCNAATIAAILVPG